MSRLVALCLLLPATAFAGGPLSDLDRFEEPEFGLEEPELEGIVNGKEEAGFPNVVALGGEFPGFGRIVACTGSVIAPRVVLTAAHCSADIPLEFVVRVGEAYFGPNGNTSTERVGFVNGVIHPDYVPLEGDIPGQQTLPEFDLGLLELAEDAPVDPIWFRTAPFSSNNVEGKKVTSVGFGITSAASRDSGIKRSAVLTVDGMDDQFLLSNVSTNPDGSNICSGDSGGPQFRKDNQTGEWEQWAVHSWGAGNCTINSASTRTDIAADWILDFVEQVHGTSDVCELRGRYGDGVCDADCDEFDEDCMVDFGRGTGVASAEEEKGGCSTVGGGASWAWLLLLPLLGRRR